MFDIAADWVGRGVFLQVSVNAALPVDTAWAACCLSSCDPLLYFSSSWICREGINSQKKEEEGDSSRGELSCKYSQTAAALMCLYLTVL